MSSTDEPYIPPRNKNAKPLPSVEITEGNPFTGYHTRGTTAEDLGLILAPDGEWVDSDE